MNLVGAALFGMRSRPAGIAVVKQSPQAATFGDPDWSANLSGVTAGNSVVVELSYYGSDVVVKIDGATMTLAIETQYAGVTTGLYYLHDVASGAGVITAHFGGGEAYGVILGQEVRGLANAAPTFADHTDGTLDGLTFSYPSQDQGGNLIYGLSVNNVSIADYWVAPTGYTLALNYSNWGAATSGASCYAVVSSPDGASLTWPVDPSVGNSAIVVFKPA